MMTSTAILKDSLLLDLKTFPVDDSLVIGEDASDDSPLHQLCMSVAATGSAELLTEGTTSSESGATLAIPIHRDGRVISVVAFVLPSAAIGTGVLEIWEPVGIYEEVRLQNGYFGHLERFCNVSSFVRFEKGSGLPGQAWASGRAVIHDDLPNHMGFLRAAGASAGLLNTAIAIPVFDDDRLTAVAVLISSVATPIAKGYEVWSASDDGFMLESSAYQSLAIESRLEPGRRLPSDDGWPAVIRRHGGAIMIEDESLVTVGRNGSADSMSAMLLMPLYVGKSLASVTAFIF